MPPLQSTRPFAGQSRRVSLGQGAMLYSGACVDELIEARKADHLRLSAESDVDSLAGPYWDDIHLVHDALPDVDHDAIDLATELIGRTLSAPLLIAGMTG